MMKSSCTCSSSQPPIAKYFYRCVAELAERLKNVSRLRERPRGDLVDSSLGPMGTQETTNLPGGPWTYIPALTGINEHF